MDEETTRDLWKLSQIREIIKVFKNGRYGDDEAIATYSALHDIMEMVEEDEEDK